MKKQNHSSITLLITSLLIIASLSSCVTKKKFLASETYRNNAELRVKELNQQMNALQTEFNTYRNEFNYSNAHKDNYIDSLSKIIGGLKLDLSSTTENIEDQTFSFQAEKRRLNQLIVEKDTELRLAKRNNEVLGAQIKELDDEIASLKLDVQNAEGRQKQTIQQLDSKENELQKLNKDLNEKAEQLKKLQATIKIKDAEIESLGNQVKLLKEQFAK